MPDWDEDSPQLRANLSDLLRSMRNASRRREKLGLATLRFWHRKTMQGLAVPDEAQVGKFRNEQKQQNFEVQIGFHRGVLAKKLAAALADFEQTLGRVVARLDELIAEDVELDEDRYQAVLDVCGWAHAEWVRIHPFANGNGRTARLLVNSLAMRYGLPPFVRLRPRPNGDYAAAGEAAMRGDWKPTASLFRRMLQEFLKKAP